MTDDRPKLTITDPIDRLDPTPPVEWDFTPVPGVEPGDVLVLRVDDQEYRHVVTEEDARAGQYTFPEARLEPGQSYRIHQAVVKAGQVRIDPIAAEHQVITVPTAYGERRTCRRCGRRWTRLWLIDPEGLRERGWDEWVEERASGLTSSHELD